MRKQSLKDRCITFIFCTRKHSKWIDIKTRILKFLNFRIFNHSEKDSFSENLCIKLFIFISFLFAKKNLINFFILKRM